MRRLDITPSVPVFLATAETLFCFGFEEECAFDDHGLAGFQA
jgi:hypothetical protein